MGRSNLRSPFFALALWLLAPAAWAVQGITVVGLFKNKAVVQIDGRRHVLSAGQTSPEGVKLISSDPESAVLEIDGRRRSYRLGRSVSTRFSGADDAPAVRIWPNSHGMFTTVGNIDGLPVNFLVDTGATTVAMNAGQARRLGIEFRVDGTPTLVHTASGTARAWRVSLDRVQIGQIALTNVAAVVLDGTSPLQVLLGMSFLGRLDLRRENGALVLRKRY